jgi:CRISPR system Cascade subunit CasC
MVYELTTKLGSKGFGEDISVIIAEQVAGIVGPLDSKKDADGYKRIKTLMFFSDAEYDAIANAITDDITILAEAVLSSSNAVEAQKESLKNIDDDKKDWQEKAKKDLEILEKQMEKNNKELLTAFNDKAIREAIKSAKLKDAADIALFGRMVANDHSLTIEAASMFSHALSTHKADNEIDFFVAVDDLQSKEESGAGMTNTLEFNSATYYRFAALNLDMLADKEHLGALTLEERQSIVRTFIEATIKAIPGARKNSMNGNTLPVYVLGVVRKKGHPVQMVNAFERPVRSSQGYAAKSVELLKSEYSKLSGTWGIEAVFEEAIPDISMKSFLNEVITHVI